jgi:hypothetical protein
LLPLLVKSKNNLFFPPCLHQLSKRFITQDTTIPKTTKTNSTKEPLPENNQNKKVLNCFMTTTEATKFAPLP